MRRTRRKEDVGHALRARGGPRRDGGRRSAARATPPRPAGPVSLPAGGPEDAASTALATAASLRVDEANISVVLPVVCADRGFATVLAERPDRAADLDRFRQVLAHALGPQLESVGMSHRNAEEELVSALDAVGPDLLVTVDGRRLRRYRGELIAVPPQWWVQRAAQLIREVGS